MLTFRLHHNFHFDWNTLLLIIPFPLIRADCSFSRCRFVWGGLDQLDENAKSDLYELQVRAACSSCTLIYSP